jgi:hypothetical protein
MTYDDIPHLSARIKPRQQKVMEALGRGLMDVRRWKPREGEIGGLE